MFAPSSHASVSHIPLFFLFLILVHYPSLRTHLSFLNACRTPRKSANTRHPSLHRHTSPNIAGRPTSIGQISSVSTITIPSSVIPNQKVGAAFGAQCIWQQLHRSSAT